LLLVGPSSDFLGLLQRFLRLYCKFVITQHVFWLSLF
jgi:hypothetical protein